MSKTGDMALDEQVPDELARAAGPELAKALREARRTIRALHGPVAWDIYERNAPEMKLIDAALKAAGLEP